MKYIITTDSGYGESSEILEADSLKHARSMAEEIATEEAMNNVSYDAEEYTEEKAEELGLT